MPHKLVFENKNLPLDKRFETSLHYAIEINKINVGRTASGQSQWSVRIDPLTKDAPVPSDKFTVEASDETAVLNSAKEILAALPALKNHKCVKTTQQQKPI